MKRDFTFKIYEKLLVALKDQGYEFQTFEQFLQAPEKKVVVLRHDCDIWPNNDLKMATIENSHGIVATYYFRVPWTFNVEVITKIRDMGHEVGYHYEELAVHNGNYEKAIHDFGKKLEQLRSIYPVKTAAMHGRPLSKWDSRDLWKKYKLEDFNLIGEPYLSVDYNDVFYLTDTGSRWDGERVSVRDFVDTEFDHVIRTTYEFVDFVNEGNLPDRILINAHAARWNDNFIVWTYRFFLQHAKNITKKYLKKLSRNNNQYDEV